MVVFMPPLYTAVPLKMGPLCRETVGLELGHFVPVVCSWVPGEGIPFQVNGSVT